MPRRFARVVGICVLLAAAAGCEKEVVRVKAGASGFIGADSVVAADASDDAGAAPDSGPADAGGGDGPCTEGALRCKDGARQRCDAAGTWQALPCPSATPSCLLGACVPCTQGQARCGEGGREVCDGGGSFQPAPCPAGKPQCFDGDCQLCLPGQRFCAPGAAPAAAVCDTSGADVESVQPCDAGVVCAEGWCQICAAGAVRCGVAGRERCASHGGAWQPDPCPKAAPLCAGDGVCHVCTPGELRCAPDAATHIERCAPSGAGWLAEVTCSGGQLCVAGACKTCAPGTTRCVGSKQLVCAADGAGYDVLADCAAAQLGCVDGACACTIGSTSCTPALPGLAAGGAVASCDASGTKATLLQSCAPPLSCSGASCVTCAPGAKRCVDDDAQVCKADGAGFAPFQLCKDGGQLCAGGGCVAACGAELGGVGCSFAGFDPPRAPTSGADSAPAASASALALHLLPRVGSLTVASATVGGLGVSPPSGNATPSSPLAFSLASWNKPASQSPTESGQPAAFALTASTAAALLLSHGSADQSAAAATLLPARGAAGLHRVIAWPSAGPGANAWVAVINRGGATTLQLTLTAAVLASPADAPGLTVPALAAGASWSATLPEGAVLLLMAAPGADLTGSTIDASGEVVVLAGHRGARVPLVGRCTLPAGAGPGSAGACVGDGALCFADADCGAPCCADPMLTTLPPVAAWGEVHVVARSAARGDAPDAVRVVAAQDGTLLLAGPDLGKPRVLRAGEPVDLLLTADAVLVADAPVAVLQLLAGGGASGLFAGATGDPAMTTLPPTARWEATHALVVPSGMGTAHLAIAAPLGTAMTLDGAPLTGLGAIGSSGFGALRVDVAPGAHRLACDRPCQAVVHGYGKAAGWMATTAWASP